MLIGLVKLMYNLYDLRENQFMIDSYNSGAEQPAQFHRYLRPGGKGGGGSSSAGGGAEESLYDYNELYEEYLNYTEHYNTEHIHNY